MFFDKLFIKVATRLVVTAVFGVCLLQQLHAAPAGGGSLPYAESADEHFHPLGKPPSKHTLKVIKKARESFPFGDTRDFVSEVSAYWTNLRI